MKKNKILLEIRKKMNKKIKYLKSIQPKELVGYVYLYNQGYNRGKDEI